MPVNSKRKGKLGELQCCHMLKSLGYTARRTQQNRGDAVGDIEVDELPNIHFEVKSGYRDISVTSKTLERAYLQSHEDAEPGKVPVVFWRRKGCTTWALTFDSQFGLLTVVGEIRRILDTIQSEAKDQLWRSEHKRTSCPIAASLNWKKPAANC